MKKKWPILLVIVLLVIAVCLAIFLRKKPKQHNQTRTNGPYFEINKITQFTETDIPCINIEIQGKQIESEIDLGSNMPICLAEEILNEMNDKKFLGMGISYGMRGIKYDQERHFELHGIKMGIATFHQLQAQEINLDCQKDAIILSKNNDHFFFKSIVGWPFFYLFNLYLDCRESITAICDSIETLQKRGYLVDCVEVPFILDHFIWLDVETDKGSLRCLLDTGCTVNFLNSTEEVSLNEAFQNPENELLSSFLKIGPLDFGPTPFVRAPIKLPFRCDAVLGMEFIHSRPMFIDFKKKKIYFAVPVESKETESIQQEI